jgi:hypothetical protein
VTETVRLTIEMAEVGTAQPGCRRKRVPAVRLPSGELVIHRTPVLEACRVLIAQGVSPRARFEAWWQGKPYPAQARAGRAAKLDVVERDRGGLRFEAWRPHPGADMPRLVPREGLGSRLRRCPLLP